MENFLIEIFSLLDPSGSSMRPLSSQHSRLYLSQRIQFKEFENHTSIGSIDLRSTVVRSQSKESQTNGTPNQESASAERVHLPGGG